MTRDRTSASDVISLLDGLTADDLDKVIAAAEQHRDAMRENARTALLEEFRTRAKALGISLEDILAASREESGGATRGRSARKGTPSHPPRVKYRNPETGETWSGRGRMPKWLGLAEQQGRSREEFAAGD